MDLIFWRVEENFSQDDCWQLSLKEETVNQPTRESSRFPARGSGPGYLGRKQIPGIRNGGHWLWDSWKRMRTLEKVEGSHMAGAQLSIRRWAQAESRLGLQSASGHIITRPSGKLLRLTC